MAASHKVVIWDITSGGIETGVTITLKYGTTPINGRTPGATVATYTETPATSGAYTISIPETNQYTVVVTGASAGEYTDIWLLGDDIISATKLAGTGASQGASLVGLRDTAGRITATTVEDALAELAGASRTTETIKSAYDVANVAKAKLVNASLANVNTLVGFGGVANASALHLHSDVYYTETELNSTGIANLRLSEAGTLKVVSGGATGHLTVGSGANATSHMGTITLDAHATTANKNGGSFVVDVRGDGTGLSGTATLKRGEGDYLFVSRYDTGDFDYSGTQFLRDLDPADPGVLKAAILRFDSRISTLWDRAFEDFDAGLWKTLWFAQGFSEALGAVTAGETLAASGFDFNLTSATESIIKRVWLTPTDQVFYNLRLRVQANVAAGSGTIILKHVTSGIQVSITVSGASDTWYTSPTLTLLNSYANPEEFVIIMKGDGTHALNVYDNMQIQVS